MTHADNKGSVLDSEGTYLLKPGAELDLRDLGLDVFKNIFPDGVLLPQHRVLFFRSSYLIHYI